jgi:hypothetical protein
VNDRHNNWDEHIDGVLLGYRASPQGSSKFSPFELMFGQKAGLPTNVRGVEEDDVVWSQEATAYELQERVEHLFGEMKDTREAAKKNIQTAQARMKDQYDIKHRGEQYKVGDRVLKYNRRRDSRMGGKLDTPFSGPYIVEEVMGKGCYRLREEGNDGKLLKQVVNAINLKVYHDQRSPSTSPTKSQKSPRTPPASTGTTPVITPRTPVNPNSSGAPKPRSGSPRTPVITSSSKTAKATPGSSRTPANLTSATTAKATPGCSRTPVNPGSGRTAKPPPVKGPHNPVSRATQPQSGTPSTPVNTTSAKRSATNRGTPVNLTSSRFPTPSASTPADQPSTPALPWLPWLNLDNADLMVIMAGQWINDKIVDATNRLINGALGTHPNQVQSTLLCQGVLGFQAVFGNHIQILHDTEHWVASARFNERVVEADSANHHISKLVATQMRQLYSGSLNRSNKLSVEVVPGDTQTNGLDCGVYAIAFGVTWGLALKDGGSESVDLGLGLDEALMRPHLVACFERGEMSPFPRRVVKKRGRKRGIRIVQL